MFPALILPSKTCLYNSLKLHEVLFHYILFLWPRFPFNSSFVPKSCEIPLDLDLLKLIFSTVCKRYIFVCHVRPQAGVSERGGKTVFSDLLARLLIREPQSLRHTVLAVRPPRTGSASREAPPAGALSTASPGSGGPPPTTALPLRPACPTKPRRCHRREAGAPPTFSVN